MRKGTILPFLIDFEEPDEQVNIAAGTKGEEVLPFCILTVSVLHDDFGNLRSIDGVREIARMDGVETVRVQRVVKVDDVHFRLHIVAVIVVQQLVHHTMRQIRVLVVIDKHGVALLHHLPEERPVNTVGFTRAGNANDHTAALGRYHIDVSLALFSFVLIGHGQVHAVFVFDELLTLLERIPVVRKMGVKTPHQTSQQDGSNQVQDISGKTTENEPDSASQIRRTHEQSQSEHQRKRHFLPAGGFGIPAADNDGHRGKEQDHKAYVPGRCHHA